MHTEMQHAIDTLIFKDIAIQELEYVVLIVGEETSTVGGVFDTLEDASRALVEKLKLENWEWENNSDKLSIQDHIFTLIFDKDIFINQQKVHAVEVHAKTRNTLNFHNL